MQNFGHKESRERHNSLEALKILSRWAAEENGAVVVKRHPNCVSIDVAEAISAAQSLGVHVTELSIHDIIPRVRAVLTVNSIVGFEALLYLKPVWVLGRCDYDAATTLLGSMEDLEKAIRRAPADISPQKIKCVVSDMANEHISFASEEALSALASSIVNLVQNQISQFGSS